MHFAHREKLEQDLKMEMKASSLSEFTRDMT